MTSLLFTIFFLLASDQASAQPQVVQRYESAVEGDSSTLTLYVDHTFKYESRGSSCWIWNDRKGTWSARDDDLYLVSSVIVDDAQDGIRTESRVGGRAGIVVLVEDQDGSPLRDARVTFNGHGYESETGADGLALVDYEDIPESAGSGWCKSRNLTQLIVAFGGRTWAFSVKTPQSNDFEVTLDLNPQSHEEIVEGTYRIAGGTLVLTLPKPQTKDEEAFPLWVGRMK